MSDLTCESRGEEGARSGIGGYSKCRLLPVTVAIDSFQISTNELRHPAVPLPALSVYCRMSLDPATFLHHTADAEKTVVQTRTAAGRWQQHAALLVAETRRQKLFVTLETPRRYLTHTLVEDGPAGEVELDFAQDYEEVAALMEAAGRHGTHDGAQGILYHNLLFLLLNP